VKIENSIGWCDATTNAVTGCDKVSPGCKNCYAEAGTRARVLRAQGIETWGPKGVRHPVNFEPVFRRLNKLCVCDKCHCAESGIMVGRRCHFEFNGVQCNGLYRRIRLFADSNSDWLDPKWPVETLAKFLNEIRLAPNVDVLLLTKRIELFDLRMKAVLASGFFHDEIAVWISMWLQGKVPPHILIGVSVEDQKRADERIPMLLKTPAAVRFLSVEPLLESVNLFKPITVERLSGNPAQFWDWTIVGGESGRDRRDCGATAIENVVAQCVNAGVPVYCKQDAALLSGRQGRISDDHWKRKEFPR
jgi:protein gp37